MSRPRPSRSPYTRRLEEIRLQQQVGAARAALRKHRAKLIGLLVGAAVVLSGAGAALAIAIDRVFR